MHPGLVNHTRVLSSPMAGCLCNGHPAKTILKEKNMDQELKLKKQNLSRIMSLINSVILKKDRHYENKMRPMLENSGHKNKKKWASYPSIL